MDATDRHASASRAAAIVVALTLLSRLLGMIRDSLLAAHTGVSSVSDAYVAAFKLPDFLNYLISGGALAATFVPVFSAYLQRKETEAAWKTFSVVMTVAAVLAAVLIVAMEVFTAPFLRLLNLNCPHAVILMAIPLARVIVPAQVFFLSGALMMGTQNAAGRYVAPALSSAVYNFGSIAGLTLLYPWLGLSGYVWGALAGAFVGSFALQAVEVARAGGRYRPSLDVRFPGAVMVWKAMLPVLLGVSLPNVDQQISSAFAAGMPTGSMTTVTYSYRLMLIPIGIFAQAIGIAVLPRFSRLAADGRRSDLRGLANRALAGVLFITIPCSALLYLLAPEVVCLVYQHRSFTALDTMRVASTLRLYCLGIFAWSGAQILSRVFYAMRDTRTPVISGTVMTVIFVLMNLWAVRRGWGTEGLAAVTTATATAHAVVLYVCLRMRLRGMRVRVLAGSIWRTLAATVSLSVIVVGVVVVARFLGDPLRSFPICVTLLTASAVLGCVAFGVTARALRMPQVYTISRLSAGAMRRLYAAISG